MNIVLSLLMVKVGKNQVKYNSSFSKIRYPIPNLCAPIPNFATPYSKHRRLYSMRMRKHRQHYAKLWRKLLVYAILKLAPKFGVGSLIFGIRPPKFGIGWRRSLE